MTTERSYFSCFVQGGILWAVGMFVGLIDSLVQGVPTVMLVVVVLMAACFIASIYSYGRAIYLAGKQ
jgi:ABC-type xylose transport system permease subunit